MRIRSESAELHLLEALLRNRRKREQRGEFLIEGVRAIDRAVASGWPLRAVLVPEGAARSSWAEQVMASGPDVVEVRPDLFARLTDRAEPPEVVLVGRIPPPDLAALAPPDDGVVVVLDRPSSPGNLGTIIRTADALGATAVLTTGHGAHLYDPQTVRASVGSLFTLPVVPVAQNRSLVDWLARWRRTAAVTVYATDEDGDLRLDRGAVLRRPALLLLGSERTGLSRSLRDLADHTVSIPMVGTASSLNVAVAHGIVLHAVMGSSSP